MSSVYVITDGFRCSFPRGSYSSSSLKVWEQPKQEVSLVEPSRIAEGKRWQRKKVS
jgi:hypothetical protein